MSSDQLQFAALNAAEIVVTGPQALHEWREKHRVHVPGYQFTPQFRWKKWDGTWAPGKYCRQVGASWEFRTSRGLLRRLMNDFQLGVAFQVARVAEIQEFLKTRPEFTELRDFQVRVFHKVLAEGWARVAFATNAGKGAVLAELAAFGNWRQDPVLILCDEIAVFDALLGEIRKWGKLQPQLVRSGVKQPPQNGVTLAMVQTLSKRIKGDGSDKWLAWLKSIRMLLCDEADKTTAASWKVILANCRNTDWRAGFSGTFATDENDLHESLQLDELLGPVVDRIKNAELVERGISAKPSVHMRAFDVTQAIGILPQEWWDMEPTARRAFAYERAITFNEARHIFIANLIKPDTPTVVIVDKIDHGLSLTAAISGAVFLDGSASEGERDDVLDRFTRGEIRVIVVTKILDRGSNRLGYAEEIIFASSEGSPTQILQRIGRGLRRGGGKEEILIIDIADRVYAGDDKRMKNAASFFNSAVKRRLEVYREEGFDVTITSVGK